MLNFETAYKKPSLENVYPLLARWDQMITYERQKGCYRDRPVAILEKGHTTATLDSKSLRAHLIALLPQVH